MTTKKELLENLQAFTADEIAEAVRNGDVTLYELSKESNGAFTPLLKRQVQTILDNPRTAPATDKSMDETPDEASAEPASMPQPETSQATEPADEAWSDGGREMENPSTNNTEPVRTNKGMFKRPFSFKVRIRRTEYGLSLIINFFLNMYLYVVAMAMAMAEVKSASEAFFAAVGILNVAQIWFSWAQSCKRCHDRGHSGWWQLIPFYSLVLLFGKGEPGSNRYGDNPKE